MCNIAPTLQAQATSWKKRQKYYKSQRTKEDFYYKTVSSRENQRDWRLGRYIALNLLRINKIIILKIMMECHASQGRLITDLRHSLFSSKTKFKFHPQLYSRPPAAHLSFLTSLSSGSHRSSSHSHIPSPNPHSPLYLSLQL